jgi:hypothetical protein
MRRSGCGDDVTFAGQYRVQDRRQVVPLLGREQTPRRTARQLQSAIAAPRCAPTPSDGGHAHVPASNLVESCSLKKAAASGVRGAESRDQTTTPHLHYRDRAPMGRHDCSLRSHAQKPILALELSSASCDYPGPSTGGAVLAWRAMSMVRHVCLAAAIVIASAFAAAAPATAKPGCGAPGKGVVAADSLGELWLSHAGALWGCLWGGRPRLLSPPSDSVLSGVGAEVMSGRYAAFVSGTADSAGDITLIFVVDLKSGRVRHFANAYGPSGYGGGVTTTVLLNANGAAAWIAGAINPNVLPPVNQVYVDDGAGYRMLASSSAIDPRSLALARNTVYWLQGGVADSAPIH